MTNLDDLKNKASEVIDDVKLKAKEAKLGAEKVADDLKHKAKETLLKGEQAVNDLKHKKDDEKEFEQSLNSATLFSDTFYLRFFTNPLNFTNLIIHYRKSISYILNLIDIVGYGNRRFTFFTFISVH